MAVCIRRSCHSAARCEKMHCDWFWVALLLVMLGIELYSTLLKRCQVPLYTYLSLVRDQDPKLGIYCSNGDHVRVVPWIYT